MVSFLFAIFIVARKISSDYMFLDCGNETYVRNALCVPMCISDDINYIYMASNCLVTIKIQ